MEQGVRSHPIPPLADITTSPHTSICPSSVSSWIGGMAIDPKSSSRHLWHDYGPYGIDVVTSGFVQGRLSSESSTAMVYGGHYVGL
jgi:hypothetical protein